MGRRKAGAPGGFNPLKAGERCHSRCDGDDREERCAKADRDDRGREPEQPLVEDELAIGPERLCDDEGRVRRFVNIYLNGDDIRFLSNLETAVKDGDELSIVPAIAGG